MDNNVPLDASVKLCASSLFYKVVRSGKHTVSTLTTFNLKKHIKTTDVRTNRNCFGNETTILYIPLTKASPNIREDVCWAKQKGPTCPKTILDNYL